MEELGIYGAVVLGHFCDMHGPSALLSTRFVDASSPCYEFAGGKLGHSKIQKRHRIQSTPLQQQSTPQPHSVASCPGCRSLPEKKAFVSFDPQLRSYYVTSRNIESQLFATVRHACVRALSCEIGSGPECTGSVVFEVEGTAVLSYVFKVLDRKARGFRRLYSLMLLLPSRDYLLSVRPYFERLFQRLASEIISYSAETFQREEPASLPPSNSRKNPMLSRLGALHRKSGNIPLRSLVELTRMEHLFTFLHFHAQIGLRICFNSSVLVKSFLHRCFLHCETPLLVHDNRKGFQIQYKQLKKKGFEGNFDEFSEIDEDVVLIDVEMRTQGVDLLHHPVPTFTISPHQSGKGYLYDDQMCPIVTTIFTSLQLKPLPSPRMSQDEEVFEIFKIEDEHHLYGTSPLSSLSYSLSNSLSSSPFSSPGAVLRGSLKEGEKKIEKKEEKEKEKEKEEENGEIEFQKRENLPQKEKERIISFFLSCLIDEGEGLKSNILDLFVYNALVGNQIIVRGDKDCVSKIVKFADLLVPTEMRSSVLYSEKFIDCYRSVVFGCSPSLQIPDYAMSSNCAVFDIKENKIQIGTVVPSQPTKLGEEILKLLLNPKISSNVKFLQLKTLILKWGNMAKAFFRMTKRISSEEDDRYLAFLDIFQLSDQDLRVLRYFTTNLRNTLSCHHKHI